ncbi:MAG: hypothetical protein EA355_06945 [Rhodobacteraceae bacterium]|nr:MAG: hypothetical protein EA355_06945 [Paracoccaceae bacterium]
MPGDGERPPGGGAAFEQWLEGWARLAAAQAAAAEALAADPEEAEADRLWRAVEAQFAQWRAAARAVGARAHGPEAAETLARFLDPGAWLLAGCDELDPTLTRLVAGPAPSDLGDFGRAALVAAPEWPALRRAAAGRRTVIARAWREVFARLSAEQTADPALAWPVAERRWRAEAEAALEALLRSDAFVAAQRRLVSAALALRAAETRLVEAFCEARALPTRREIDDLHRTVTDLRRELRALKRDLGRE